MPFAKIIRFNAVRPLPTICRLSTIKDLRASVREDMHSELTDVFSNHTFVGIVDDLKRIAAFQS
ncbi:MAG: hypothetical protein EOP09_18595, partial [Proteobacteria bacterium]